MIIMRGHFSLSSSIIGSRAIFLLHGSSWARESSTAARKKQHLFQEEVDRLIKSRDLCKVAMGHQTPDFNPRLLYFGDRRQLNNSIIIKISGEFKEASKRNRDEARGHTQMIEFSASEDVTESNSNSDSDSDSDNNSNSNSNSEFSGQSSGEDQNDEESLESLAEDGLIAIANIPFEDLKTATDGEFFFHLQGLQRMESGIHKDHLIFSWFQKLNGSKFFGVPPYWKSISEVPSEKMVTTISRKKPQSLNFATTKLSFSDSIILKYREQDFSIFADRLLKRCGRARLGPDSSNIVERPEEQDKTSLTGGQPKRLPSVSMGIELLSFLSSSEEQGHSPNRSIFVEKEKRQERLKRSEIDFEQIGFIYHQMELATVDKAMVVEILVKMCYWFRDHYEAQNGDRIWTFFLQIIKSSGKEKEREKEKEHQNLLFLVCDCFVAQLPDMVAKEPSILDKNSEHPARDLFRETMTSSLISKTIMEANFLHLSVFLDCIFFLDSLPGPVREIQWEEVVQFLKKKVPESAMDIQAVLFVLDRLLFIENDLPPLTMEAELKSYVKENARLCNKASDILARKITLRELWKPDPKRQAN